MTVDVCYVGDEFFERSERENKDNNSRFHPVEDIEQVNEAKLLGVIINIKFHSDSHIQVILWQCSQCLYVLSSHFESRVFASN